MRAVKQEFNDELRRVTRLIDDGDNAGAHFHAETMLREKVTYLYEYAVLQARIAETHARTGDLHRALEASHRATTRYTSSFPRVGIGDALPASEPDQYMLPKEWLKAMLQMQISLSARQGLVADALQAAYELSSLNGTKPDPELARQRDLLVKALGTGEQLVGRIGIGEYGYWRHYLSRDSFTIDDVEGEITALELVCGPQTRALKFAPDLEWTVPPSWRDCAVTIEGKPNTTLNIVEFAP